MKHWADRGKPKTSRVLVPWGLIAMSLHSLTAAADTSIFCGAADQLRKIQLVPAAQMDTDMLLESAKTILDPRISSEQRLLNHYWMPALQPIKPSNPAPDVIALSLVSDREPSHHAGLFGQQDPFAEEHTALLAQLGLWQVRVSGYSSQLIWQWRF
jgi:hypothetical protein